MAIVDILGNEIKSSDNPNDFTFKEKLLGHYTFKNSDKFKESALHFQEFGRYTNDYPGTRSFNLFWAREKERCLKGFHAGFDYISGYNYFYLNYSPIMIARESIVEGEFKLEGDQVQGERILAFPEFWDSDYLYFTYLNEAELRGSHGCVFKTRGRGYSFKGGSMLCRNFFLIPESKSFAMASDKEFLLKDGLLTKAWDNMSFLNQHTAWRKRREFKDTELQKRASYLDMDTNAEVGYKSEIMGVTLKNDPNKARGKRGKLILWEEGGQFPNLLKSWQVARPSMEQGKITYGLMVAFGTGGSKDADYSGLEELFYHPKAYNILPVDNIWDIDAADTKCGYFVPEYMNMEGYYDKDGNSDRRESIKVIEAKREVIKLEASDIDAVEMAIAEKPLTPQEAVKRTSGIFFPQGELNSWLLQLTTDKRLMNIGTHGSMEIDVEGKVTFIMNHKAKEITEYPIKKGSDKTGCVTIYYSPHKINNKVPPNTYYIVADPYGLQTDGGESLGAVYVFCHINNYTTHPDDCVVAKYIGRPKYDQDEWNKQLFMLAEYYNAPITPENDRGNIIDYARHNKLLRWLEPEFPILDNKGEVRNVHGRGYGVSMSNQELKKQGIIYLVQWLMTKRGMTAEGKQKYNYHYLYDAGAIREMLRYNLKGNFDRVSALLISQFVRREQIDRGMKGNKESNLSKFKKIKFGVG